MKSGYLYVLVHPSDPNLYKVGQTTRHPEKRLVEHNSDFAKHAGRIVKETGQKWAIKTYIPVPDTNWAESTFWSATGLADLPYREGIEVERMEWSLVETGLNAAKKAGRCPPSKLPDYVYANTAWVKKRLEGRGITLLGHVKSKTSGRNNFRCDNGHEWRTIPKLLARGRGCPVCGMGEQSLEEIREAEKSGVLLLLVHPDRPGLIKIALRHQTLAECSDEDTREGWEIHRYRSVDEPALAESIIWKLVGHPLPLDRGPIRVDLEHAEQAFRKLHDREVEEIALVERTKETKAN